MAAQKRGRGRPSSYRPEYAEQARKLLLLGFTREKLADFFGTSVATLYNWREEHPEFLEGMDSGDTMAHAEVAASLFERAKGFERKEVKIFQFQGEPVIVPFTAYYPPDVSAASFFLKNRQPELWKDRREEKVEAEATAADGARAVINLKVTRGGDE